jgi:putative FmdB family regulatory protein
MHPPGGRQSLGYTHDVPTYEYECTSCGQHIEVFQRISEDPLTTCGVCGGALRKVFHPAGIVFKGSGFYATDSRTKKASGDGTGGTKSEPSKTESPKPAKEKSAGSKSGEGSSS